MVESVAAVLAFHYHQTHARFLKVVEELDDAQLRRQWPHANSIGFDAWHCGRWADHLQMLLPRMTEGLASRLGAREQIWVKESLARRWGYPADKLGHVETGMGMDESLAAALPLPDKTVLLDYVRRSFSAADDAVGRMVDSDLLAPAAVTDDDAPWLRGQAKGPPASWVVGYSDHDNRHLGMIEARRGLIGLRGSATV